MSEHASPPAETGESVTLETGLEALRSSPEFRGPVEPLGEHAHANDHFALIYESQSEQFAAAIPFLRQGLERGERCLYITYENSREEVVAAMRDYGIDVDAALDSGQLSIHDEEETYLRNETFDADETIEFLDAAIEEATEEYEALRVTGEMSSVLREDPEGEELVRCEAKANYLFDDVDGLALCQYNRNRFSADVIREVISTHPLLIHDNRVSYNVHYTPPGEYFGPEKSARKVDRLLESLREQTDAKVELRRRERYLRESYEITSDPTRSFEEKLDALFYLGCERFDLDFGFLNRVDPDADRLEVEYASDDHEYYKPGDELPLSETYCRAAVDIEAAANVSNPAEEGFDDRLVYEDFGVDGYLGTYIPVDGGMDRTLAFVPDGSYEESFSEQDKAYLELMGQWVGYELDRRQRERFLRECYEITSDSALDFEAKLHQLLDLARGRMNLDAAGLTHLPEWDGRFLTEYAIGYSSEGDGVVDASDDMWTDPAEGCYCRQAIVEDEPIGMADVRDTEWEDDEVYREHGLTCYLGTKVTSGSTPYGTLWVGSEDPRDREFSETERTFLELIGQWVSYEIERRDHNEAQRELYEITSDPDRSFDEKLDALFELGCEQFGVEFGGMAKVDREADRLEVEHVSGDHQTFEAGLELPLTETLWATTVEADAQVSFVDPVAEGYDDHRAYRDHGFETYLGTALDVEGSSDRTFFFASEEPRDAEFSEAERTFLDLMGQWVEYELERRERERELRERTEYLSALVETTPECIKTVAEDGTLLQMNSAGLDMVEAPVESDVVGECVYDLIAPEHRQRFREFNERICRGERGTLEFDIVGLEGTRRHMESHAAPLHRPDGTTAHVALTRDVTERKERERALEESERRYRTLVENFPNGSVGLFDETYTYKVVGGELLDDIGLAPDDVVGTTIYDRYPDDFIDEIEANFSAVFDGESNVFEIDIGDRVLLAHTLPVRNADDEIHAGMLMTQDVTERMEREQELQRKERRFEAIFEDPNILVGLLDPDGTVLDINQTAMEYIDADLDAVTGEPFWETPWWGEGDEVQSDVREWVERAATGEYVDFEADLTRPDGQRYTLDGVFRPVTNEEGDVVSVIVSDRDITERKERERALAQSEQRYRTLAESFPNGIVTLFDEELQYTLAAGRAFEDLPVSRGDVEGRTLRGVWDDDVADALEPLCRAALDGEKSSIEVSYEGREWVIYAVPVTDESGNVFAGMTMAQNITERKENQQKLKEQNERLESFASMLAHELRNPVTIGQIYSQQLPGESSSEAVDYVTEAFDRIEDMIDVMLVLARGRKAVGEEKPIELSDVAQEAWEDIDAADAELEVELDQTIRADETYIRHLFYNLLDNAVEHGGDGVTVTVGELSDGFYVADDGVGISVEEGDSVFDEGYTTAADSGGTGLGLAFVQKLAEVYEWDCAVTESATDGARFEFRSIAGDQ
ncbi:MEDS domain-containing protein [Halorussus salinisoli]|uniref:MEDS domain-containing protein n=1 Tax=Halorussus salinisoli TaxID=2558242 RepID=UPI0010C1738D|nr:MEDS domain-containing protein [Halorussus salinisoli]